jgi:hypothetical protein
MCGIAVEGAGVRSSKLVPPADTVALQLGDLSVVAAGCVRGTKRRVAGTDRRCARSAVRCHVIAVASSSRGRHGGRGDENRTIDPSYVSGGRHGSQRGDAAGSVVGAVLG